MVDILLVCVVCLQSVSGRFAVDSQKNDSNENILRIIPGDLYRVSGACVRASAFLWTSATGNNMPLSNTPVDLDTRDVESKDA